MQEAKKIKTVIIEDVKNCIAITDHHGDSLRGICDCIYKIALSKGKTEQQAAVIALDGLGSEMLKFLSAVTPS